MPTADDADRGDDASKQPDLLPSLPPRNTPRSEPRPTPPLAAPPLATPSAGDTTEPAGDNDAPTLPPRNVDATAGLARVGPPPSPPPPTTHAGDTGDDPTSPRLHGHEPDPEAIAALQQRAARLRRRNRVVQAAFALAAIVAVAAAAYFGYRAYDREQDDRQPPATERPTSEELLEELDGDG